MNERADIGVLTAVLARAVLRRASSRQPRAGHGRDRRVTGVIFPVRLSRGSGTLHRSWASQQLALSAPFAHDIPC